MAKYEEGLILLDRFINQFADELPKPVARLVNVTSSLPEDRFTRDVLKTSELADEMSAAAQRRFDRTGRLEYSRQSELPKVVRDTGFEAPLGYNISDFSAANINSMSPANRRRLEENINRTLDMDEGDPNFYWDLNAGLERSAPELGPTVRALTFAPFSMANAVKPNLRLWQRFIENPAMFPGSFAGEGALTAKAAYAKALKILTKPNPTVADLQEAGKVLKIGSFGENILKPGSSMRATVDRHAYRNALGMYLPDTMTGTFNSESAYRVFEDAFRAVAARRGMAPHEVQSAAWDVWRKMMQNSTEQGMLDASDFIDLNVSRIASLPHAARKDALKRLMPLLNTQDYIDSAFKRSVGLE